MKSKIFLLALLFFLKASAVISSEKGMPQLNTEFWIAQIFWLIIIFSILYVVCWKLFIPKISDSIENRRVKIMNDLNETQNLKEQAEKKLLEYEKIIQNSKNEAKKAIEESRKKVENEIKIKRKKFFDEIEKELMKAEKEIKELKTTSLSKIEAVATEITKEITKKIINTEVNTSNVLAIVQSISKKNMEKHK